MRLLIIFFMAFFVSHHADAYSYSAQGKEPLIEGRNAIINSLKEGNKADVAKYFTLMRDDVEFLGNKYDKTLLRDFEIGIAAMDVTVISTGIHRLFAAEIQRRLKMASRNLDKYQTAKVMVVKSIRFFDMIAPELEKPVAHAVKQGLNECLNAIGKPGVFGAGQMPADPKAYDQALKNVVKAFAQ